MSNFNRISFHFEWIQVYWAVEDTDCCTHYCLGSIRPFDIKIWDIHQNEVIHFCRPFSCTCWCFQCCYMQSIEISSPPGRIIGRVTQTSTYFYSNFDIKNHLNKTVLRIEGPRFIWRCYRDIDFKVNKQHFCKFWDIFNFFNSDAFALNCRSFRWMVQKLAEYPNNGQVFLTIILASVFP